MLVHIDREFIDDGHRSEFKVTGAQQVLGMERSTTDEKQTWIDN